MGNFRDNLNTTCAIVCLLLLIANAGNCNNIPFGYEKQLNAVNKLLNEDYTPALLKSNKKLTVRDKKKALNLLNKLAKLATKRDFHKSSVGHRSLAILAAETRKEKDPVSLNKIFKLIKDYSDFSIITDWSSTKPETAYFNPKLLPMLELAHYLAITTGNPRVPESMKILNFAEGKTNGLDKCYTLFKSAEVLYELGDISNNNFDRAERYLDDCLTYGNDYFKPEKTSSSGKEKQKPGYREWLELCRKIEALRFDIDIALLAKECGSGYAKYVEMRSYYSKKEYFDAFCLARELKAEYPGTVYGEAGRFYWCKMLLMNDRGREYRDKTLPSGVKKMQKFIEDKPYGLYRGKAWMALGEFYLTHKWDREQASIYYKKALEWFREVRNRKDSIDLFAKSTDTTEQQNKRAKLYSAPLGKTSSIDEWKRTKVRKQNPKEIINRMTSPWYINENEKECLFMVGFFLFVENKFDEAKKHFLQVRSISRDLAFLDQKSIPNAIMRLRGACKQGFLIARPEEMKSVREKNRLKFMLGDLKYVLEQFDDGYLIFESIFEDPKSSYNEKALALVGMGNCLRLKDKDDAGDKAIPLYTKAFEEYPKSPAASHAMLGCAYLASYGYGEGRSEAERLFRQCHKRYPTTHFGEEALARLVVNSYYKNRPKTAKYAALYRNKYPNGAFNDMVSTYIKKLSKKGEEK